MGSYTHTHTNTIAVARRKLSPYLQRSSHHNERFIRELLRHRAAPLARCQRGTRGCSRSAQELPHALCNNAPCGHTLSSSTRASPIPVSQYHHDHHAPHHLETLDYPRSSRRSARGYPAACSPCRQTTPHRHGTHSRTTFVVVTTTTQMHAGATTLQLTWTQAQLLAAVLCEHQNAYSFKENETKVRTSPRVT